jgi:hypothetical protein
MDFDYPLWQKLQKSVKLICFATFFNLTFSIILHKKVAQWFTKEILSIVTKTFSDVTRLFLSMHKERRNKKNIRFKKSPL